MESKEGYYESLQKALKDKEKTREKSYQKYLKTEEKDRKNRYHKWSARREEARQKLSRDIEDKEDTSFVTYRKEIRDLKQKQLQAEQGMFDFSVILYV